MVFYRPSFELTSLVLIAVVWAPIVAFDDIRLRTQSRPPLPPAASLATETLKLPPPPAAMVPPPAIPPPVVVRNLPEVVSAKAVKVSNSTPPSESLQQSHRPSSAPSPVSVDEARPGPLPSPQSAVLQATRERLPGSVLLGGKITLGDLDEKPMQPAARIERTLENLRPDSLSSLPEPHRQTLRPLLRAADYPLKAQVVRLAASHLQAPTEILLTLRAGQSPEIVAIIETGNLVSYDNASADNDDRVDAKLSPHSQALIQNWIQRQPHLSSNQVQPVLLVLEPLAVGP